MTTGAWIMMGITWAVVAFFTIRFFVMIFTRDGGDR